MIRCADAAGTRADPLAGTAPPAHRWLLLEHPGPWPVDAVAGSGIESGLLAAMTDAAARTRTRILLVRRPGRHAPSPRRCWQLLTTDGATMAGSWVDDADLAAAVAALEAPPRSRLAGVAAEPLVLVCAHGVHDTCCAVRGRPVAAALAERWPEQVWECSHVGGDRFAPNVVLLPDGFYYGGLDPAGAVDVVAGHLAGQVRAAALRGTARYPPAQQAAVVAAFDRYGPLPAGAVTVIAARHEGGYGTADSRTFVELAVAGVSGPVRAEVVAVRRPPAHLTCRAIGATIATEYRVERLG